MKIAIIGFDTEGKATYDYLVKLGGQDITICDQNPDITVPDGVKTQLGANYLKHLDRFDAIVRTAGLPPAKILAENSGIDESITTHTNLFFGATPTNNIIGVTGTKGKGTTSTLIAKMLAAAGKDVHLGGNIGVPPLTFLDKLSNDSWVVLELSSFQLIDLRYAPHIAVCLMVVPEHLNWHADMAEYAAAKSHLFAHQTTDDIAISLAGNETSQQIASVSQGRHIPYFAAPGAEVIDNAITIDGQVICKTSELKLLGAHNWQNACAAVTAVWQVTQDVKAIKSVLTSFSGLEHRLEFVRELDGIKYYDDSFVTTPETATVAIQAFTEPKVVILGGSDKNANFDELARAVKDGNVRHAVVVGDTAPKIIAALDTVGFHDYSTGATTMADMVAACRQHAKLGDVVLLSTGCASFGLFQDYKDRGNQFKQQVAALSAAD